MKVKLNCGYLYLATRNVSWKLYQNEKFLKKKYGPPCIIESYIGIK